MSRKRRKRKCKCLNCGEMYLPDPRTADRQRHCSKPECKRASKAWRQRRWLSKPRNRDYFRGPEHVERTRRWRAEHPGYWRRGSKSQNALQDDLLAQPADKQEDRVGLALDALQDDCLLQPPLVVGLIAQLTGSALQDDIAMAARRMHAYGQTILGIGPGMEHERKRHDRQASLVPRAGASRSHPVQLAGPSAGT